MKDFIIAVLLCVLLIGSIGFVSYYQKSQAVINDYQQYTIEIQIKQEKIELNLRELELRLKRFQP